MVLFQNVNKVRMIQFFNLAGKHYLRIQMKRVQGLLLEKNMLTVKRLAKTQANKKRLISAVHDLEQNIITYYKNDEQAEPGKIDKLIAEVKELQQIVHAAVPTPAPAQPEATVEEVENSNKLLKLARSRKIKELERLHDRMRKDKAADRDEIDIIAKKISSLKEEDLLN